MSFQLEEPVLSEYNRCCTDVGEDDPYTGHKYVGIHDVIKAHYLIAEFFYLDQGAGIGGIGPRDINLLHSAVGRQHAAFMGTARWNSPLEICATLFYGLIKDHPFHDANKRTALLTALFHLKHLGLQVTTKDEELDQFTVEIAEGQLTKYSRFRELKKIDPYDAEVLFIADFLKRNTRKIANDFRVVTYSQLNKILKNFGYELLNPFRNHIDVVRFEDRKKYLGLFGPSQRIGDKVCQIGFPGWTTQVNQGAIKTVRESTKLISRFGVDSETFYNGADPLGRLITRYQEPLRRLADK